MKFSGFPVRIRVGRRWWVSLQSQGGNVGGGVCYSLRGAYAFIECVDGLEGELRRIRLEILTLTVIGPRRIRLQMRFLMENRRRLPRESQSPT